MTITALPSDTLSQLQRQAAENVRSRVQQTNGANTSATSRLPEQSPENRTPDQFSRAELETRLNELREQRLQAREQRDTRQSRFDAEQPSELLSLRQQELRTEQRVEQSIEQREQRQERAAERAQSIEEQRARRIRENVEAREVRQQENAQEAVQRREAEQTDVDQRIVTETRERARQLQNEAQEAQRRDAERLQERLDDDVNDTAQQRFVNPAIQQPDENSVQASNEPDTEQADVVEYSEPPQTIAPEADSTQDAQTPNELIDILREEADIIETLLRQQEIGVTLSDQQLDVELAQVRESLREEVERNARILQNNLPATSRLGNFIDQVS